MYSIFFKIFFFFIFSNLNFTALPASFNVGWNLIAGPNVSMADFLSTYENVEKVYTYQSDVWMVKERIASLELSNATTFAEFNVDYGYWVFVNPISKLSKSGSQDDITVIFDIASIPNIPSLTMSLDYSLNSGNSWISSTNFSGTTYPASSSSSNIITWLSSLDIQTIETNVLLKVNAIYGEQSAYIVTGPFTLSNSASSPTTEVTNVSALTYKIAHTAQTKNYNDSTELSAPSNGSSFYGQDPIYMNNAVSYTNHGDGTVTDNVTGLMWQQNQGTLVTFDNAVSGAATFNAGGYNDWRLPNIKELYSLIVFSGKEGESTANGSTTTSLDAVPFIHSVFEFNYISPTDRYIDIQNWTSSQYVSTTMNGDATVFGVNFADGRIKGYPKTKKSNNSSNEMLVRYVRGNNSYSINQFVDNGNETITDQATGLTWMKNDSATGLNWQAALNYCEGLSLANQSDWRLPHIKEIQSLVDYSKSPDTSGGQAAIDSIFNISTIPAVGDTMTIPNYPYFWSSTTHVNHLGATRASYITFGEALGWMPQSPNSSTKIIYDVHGAGSQKSDPKAGNALDYPEGFGPQGDVIIIENHVRCVR